jgi:hypothetical protein
MNAAKLTIVKWISFLIFHVLKVGLAEASPVVNYFFG